MARIITVIVLLLGIPGLAAAEAQLVPIAGDFDGNGTRDVGMFQYRKGGVGTWIIGLTALDGHIVDIVVSEWGSLFHGDVPATGDYDGDGQTDIAIYRTTTGEWLIRRSSDGGLTQMAWGSPFWGDVPMPADYDGDGITDVAIFRSTTSELLARRSSDGRLFYACMEEARCGIAPH